MAVRLLRADEIECRIGTINEKGLSLLLFKDARVDQKILDETFGEMGWNRSHQMIGGNLYCTVEVWDREKCQWVIKQDVGTASYSEAEKGQASDSFKRACVNWGIGRELYTAPFIWVPADKVRIERKGQGNEARYYTNERFRVKSIGYDNERAISSLVIMNSRRQSVYALLPPETETENSSDGPEEGVVQKGISPSQKTALDRELERTGVSMEKVLARYGLQDMGQMTQESYADAMKGLKKSKDRKKVA